LRAQLHVTKSGKISYKRHGDSFKGFRVSKELDVRCPGDFKWYL